MSRVLKGLFYFFVSIGDGVIFACSLLVRTILSLVYFLDRIILTRLPQKSKKVYKLKKHNRKPITLPSKLSYFFLGAFTFGVFICTPLVIIVFLTTLPNPTLLAKNLSPQTTTIYDRHGTVLYQIYADQNRMVVPLSRIPLSLREATIAIEDKNFYSNPGFDIIAITRAFINNVTHKNIQGASTITQQLIKSALLTPERSIERKIEEIILATWAERLYSKDQILTMYFNQIPYGGSAWGAETASQTYLGKDVWNVDLAESAFLAGLPQSPTVYSPFNGSSQWKDRQKEVLDRMLSIHSISQDQYQSALSEQLHFLSPRTPLYAPHFVFYVKDYLEEHFGSALVEKGGLNVTTTLDLPLQQQVENTIASEVLQDAYLHVTNGAAVVTNPKTGDILAMVGSSGYENNDGNYNVTTAIRPPGSSIKIVTYAYALSHGFTPATILDDSPISYTGSDGSVYAPVNYDGKFHGQIPLRIAFANSFNVPAVKTLNTIGVNNFVMLGRSMGLTHLKDASQYGLAATLGGVDTTMLDMTTAYGVLANGGTRVDLNPILKITDTDGHMIEQKQNVSGIRVLGNDVTFLISSILSDNNARSWEFGTNSPLVISNHTVAVKTGTSDDKKDNWTFGYTKDYVVSAWVGNNDNSPMSQNLASGITGAAPIWHDIFSYILQNKNDEPFTIPPTVISKPCFGKTEYFIQGTENKDSCVWAVTAPTVPPTPTH